MLDGIICDIARRHFLAGMFGAVEHPGGHGGAVLDQFLGVVRSDRFDRLDGGPETWDNFFLQ